jgi:hypothetical protein
MYNKTKMERLVNANIPGIFRKLRGLEEDDIQVNKYAGGYPYKLNGVLRESDSRTPIYSYAKNYKKYNEMFCIFLWSPESDIQKIEKFMDDSVKLVKKDQIKKIVSDPVFSNWQYLDTEYKGDK